MGSFTRFTRYIKDFWKVVIRGENDDLRLKTLSMEEELARLRHRRMASDREREAAALIQARNAVQKIREIHDNLLVAEKAAAEFAAKLGEAAKSSIEAHNEMHEQACKKFFIQQKQQMFAQKAVPELQTDTNAPVSPSNEQEKENRVPELKTSRAAEDKDIIFAAMGVDGSNGTEPSQPNSHAVEAAAEENQEEVMQSMMNPLNKDGASSSQTSTSTTADNLESIDEIPPEMLAQVLDEVKKQVRDEEKSHLDELSRNRAILEKEIEAREMAEHASMPKDNH